MKILILRYFWPRSGLFVLFFVLCVAIWMPPLSATARSPSHVGPGHILPYGQLWVGGKSQHQQDATWLKLKLTHKLHQLGKPNAVIPQLSSSYLLSTDYVKQISEPPPTGKDAAGHSYIDDYFWYLCGPGATNVAMDYWPIPNNRNFGDHNFSDHHTTTNWNNGNFRAYTMYIADQVKPPWYTSPGEETFGSYPSAYTTFNDLRDAMNWEASGHASNWSTYFYAVVGAGSMSSSDLLNDVMSDVGSVNVPPVISVNDSYLPDWIHSGSKGTSHFVSIIGYDNNQHTYTYIETCTQASCGTSNTGVFTVPQQTLYNGMENDNGNGGIVW